LSGIEAVSVDAVAGNFESMRTLAPPTARGWEAVADDQVWDWSGELAELPVLLAEKTKSPSVVAGPTDLVIDPTNLWLTIHESIGHATEYDRAIGYEAVLERDYQTLVALNFIVAALVLVGNLVSDLLYAVVDPRVRLE
jgi:TldD protein